jgi:hypothetical protein
VVNSLAGENRFKIKQRNAARIYNYVHEYHGQSQWVKQCREKTGAHGGGYTVWTGSQTEPRSIQFTIPDKPHRGSGWACNKKCLLQSRRLPMSTTS